jgi:hypothetical protein
MDRHILTKEELKTLKQADILVFRNNKIDCIKEETKTLKEQRVSIYVTSNYTDLPQTCAYVAMCCQVNVPIITTLHSLKAGDKIYSYFYKDAGTNDLLKKNGLHCDRLYLNIYRGKKLYQYFIGDEISLNNSARMIQ